MVDKVEGQREQPVRDGLQERERISREMHDELSQMIGALALLAQLKRDDRRALVTALDGIAEGLGWDRDEAGSAERLLERLLGRAFPEASPVAQP